MAITKITSNVLASNAAQDNLNAGSVIVFTKPLSATNTNITGNLTVTGTLSASNATFDTGSIATSQPLTLTQTWANTATTYTGMRVNVTDSGPSNAASLLMDLQVGGVRKLKIDKAGAIYPAGSNTNRITGDSSQIYVGNATQNFQSFREPNFVNAANVAFAWCDINNSASSGTVSLFLFRDANNTLAQRNGLNAQESRIYSTYTDAANYERFFIKTNVGSTSATQIGLSAAGTGQNRSLEFVAGGSTRMTLTSGGLVGIGTAIPGSGLHVSGALGTNTNTRDSAAALKLTNTSGGSWLLTSGVIGVINATFCIRQESTVLPALTITATTNNIGIGTNFPTEKLTVVGNISATGVVAAGSMVKFPNYLVADLSSVPLVAGAMIYVSDDVDGPTMAFCNGSNWLRVRDNAIVTTEP